ncbi:MAG TPA: hypothetical protein IAA58_02220 [Candidatus Gallacutalibacter stercoravium]|nr:hypothetical protein [Candidatus Gallacutalibacter stercoravium]
MKKFAFILMGEELDPSQHKAEFATQGQLTSIRTVRNFEQAKQLVLSLQKEGYGAIELCGAFGAEKAQELTQMTGGSIAIGYVVHDPALDKVFSSFWG